MLRAKALTPLLAQLNGAGVKASMLLAPDGRLLCYTSVPDFVETDRLIGSVAAHAFSEYRGACRAGFEPPAEADFLSVELEGGTIAVLSLNENFLLCSYADSTAHVGAIKMKLEAARRDLAEPLARVGSLDAAGPVAGGSA